MGQSNGQFVYRRILGVVRRSWNNGSAILEPAYSGNRNRKSG
jgi:hypothetical protein